jgi:hypothetical protein
VPHVEGGGIGHTAGMSAPTGAALRVRELLDADDVSEGSLCEGIPEEACSEAPRNFALNAANGVCTKTAEQLASPGVVLPLLLTAVGAPVALAGTLEPVRRGASLLPGLIVSGRMRAFERRKGFWVAAGLVQAATLVVSAAAAAALSGLLAGVVVVVMLALFSLASGAGSVAFGDVMGKTIMTRRRGRLLGLRAAAGGRGHGRRGRRAGRDARTRGAYGRDRGRTHARSRKRGPAPRFCVRYRVFADSCWPAGWWGSLRSPCRSTCSPLARRASTRRGSARFSRRRVLPLWSATRSGDASLTGRPTGQ